MTLDILQYYYNCLLNFLYGEQIVLCHHVQWHSSYEIMNVV
jgi:hypothetical protein